MTEAYACSLNDEQLAARRRQWKQLEERVLMRVEAFAGGRLLVYGGGDETARTLAALIDAERECCPFLAFVVERRGDEVRLTLSFPEAGSTAADFVSSA